MKYYFFNIYINYPTVHIKVFTEFLLERDPLISSINIGGDHQDKVEINDHI